MVSVIKHNAVLNISGIRYIVREIFQFFFGALLLFGAAGTLQWTRGWIYIGLVCCYEIVMISVLMFKNPSLINERGKIFRQGTKNFDKIFFMLYLVFSMLTLLISGFDVVRYKWSNLPFFLIYPAIVVFSFSTFLGIWAMVSNPFFSVMTRIQKDHEVCSRGPYRFIRHPGYTAWTLSALMYPFLLGSAVSFVPVVVMILIFIIRTYLEDTTLKRELTGYPFYVKRVRYRLFPYVW